VPSGFIWIAILEIDRTNLNMSYFYNFSKVCNVSEVYFRYRFPEGANLEQLRQLSNEPGAFITTSKKRRFKLKFVRCKTPHR
jgi:hypothetical protein